MKLGCLFFVWLLSGVLHCLSQSDDDDCVGKLDLDEIYTADDNDTCQWFVYLNYEEFDYEWFPVWNTSTLGWSDVKSWRNWQVAMWFTDNVWTGVIKDYQSLLQTAFQNATMDVYEKRRDNMSARGDYEVDTLTVDDFYFNVTFLLGFCLKEEELEECDIISIDDLEEYEEDGEITGCRDKGTWYVYSSVYADKTTGYADYVHDLLDFFSKDYMLFASYRLQCLYKEYPEFDEDLIRAYKGYALYVAPLVEPVPWGVPAIMSYAVGGFVGCCFLLAIVGWIHGYWCWKADCIRVSGLIYFGFYTWDFYSDIVFALSLTNYYDDGVPKYLFYISIGFIVVPWLANMLALSRYQNKWCKDESIRERVYQWFVSWQRLTYALAALSGSAFGTVELANSYIFGFDFFCMGLNERHLKKFNNNRLYSTIIIENAPQLIIQFYFFSIVGWSEILDAGNYISLMALLSSSLSILVALLDIYASKKLFSVLKKDGKYVDTTACTVFLISAEVKKHQRRLQISTYAIREAIAETLSTHPRSVEMHFPIAIANGFKVKFTVFSPKLTIADIKQKLKKGAETRLPTRIQEQWKLEKPIKMPVSRITVEQTHIVDDDDQEGKVQYDENATTSRLVSDSNNTDAAAQDNQETAGRPPAAYEGPPQE